MAILKLAENLYIAPQLTAADAAQAAALGVQAVICNRPDGEEPDQPAAAEVKQWLADAGIGQFAHQPVTAPAAGTADATAFQNLFAQSDKPVLAYCRTGTRSALLWALYQVQNGMSVAEAKTAAARADVDLTNFEAKLQAAKEAV